ncbi:tRNA (adenosine(37)-N6)-threonylcarbamoyltransferase complex dimerization subunit type 1 TsaB [Antrihabitans cavernicola]|uniref:tRNA (Adenosine(37)-N6)-threonylcarbamoyltransferase complex dimerization subunit type 1 TsaB n=1 Tax=Antrihabitans cavernicola TaxID=2495913 RepID=A0A5A7SDD3_9NOCA|nr:tRNA (adenosine(37)-N6)-threonylcarbamoyltransferase complex dimerization subunit type 1 TsaB [Spelaeibacter cavernicola]KAA0022747.1 tRNA (adenosine(37)-N6)-threonylcarbamoyltransferase complex dimerization subunit type 1 TsaB [Spelaeibacter cavernicola]
MLVLAVDTSTPAVTAGLVALDDSGHRVLATRLTVDARAHAELLTPHIMECLAESGSVPADLDAVVVGVGPGPFTGLRVGMATAAGFADALHIPVYGICSLDAIAHQVGPDRELLVVTDARRREVYWARYRDGVRFDGPGVEKPSALEVGSAAVIAGSPSHVDLFDVPVEPVESPSALGLVLPLAAAILSGAAPEPIVPLYLRRPDAVEQAARAR